VIDQLPVFIPDKTARLKIEQTASNGQLIRVFVQYVQQHPEAENKGDLLVFCQALLDVDLMKEVKVGE
jgi:hypothetical protein